MKKGHGCSWIKNNVYKILINFCIFFRFVGLDEFVTADKTSLLNRSVDTEYCEMDFNINSKYELDSFSLVSDCNKMELFNGSFKEFYQIFYGNLIDEFEETRSYRYDIVCKQLSNEFTLKVYISKL